MTTHTPSLQNNLGFLNTLQSVKPHSPEGAVQFLWQVVVTEWFPGREGYKWSFKPAAPVENDMPNVTVIQVRSPQASSEWTERQILRVECKHPSSGDWNWDSTVSTQIQGKRLFGVLAVGRKDTFDMGDSDGIAQVGHMMDYIKVNAWQWSGS